MIAVFKCRRCGGNRKGGYRDKLCGGCRQSLGNSSAVDRRRFQTGPSLPPEVLAERIRQYQACVAAQAPCVLKEDGQ